MIDEDNYPAEILAAIREVLAETLPGEWGELGLCPGPYGCPYETAEAAIAAGVEEHFCDGCRVFRVYRPAEANFGSS